VNNVAVIHERGAYGDGLEQVFRTAFEKPGRTVRSFPYASSSERDQAIVAAGTAAPQYVLFFSSLSQDGVAFLNAVSALQSYANIRIFLTDSAANNDVLAGAAGAAAVFPRVIGSRPSVPSGPVYELFKTSFTAAYRQDPNAFTFVPHAYDASWLVMYGSASALRREGRISGTGIARGLRRVSADGAEIPVSPASWRQIADTLGSGGAVDVSGASGPLDYDPATEETSGSVEIWRISADGRAIEATTVIQPR
jgi:branched-chain amino acid transport system substrate-binding protein